MKVLLDENVSRGLVHSLRDLGYDVLVVGIEIPSGTDDDSIYQILLKEKAVLITRDYHFTNPVRFDEKKTQGILYIHHGNLTSVQEMDLVASFLKKHSQKDFEGKLVTIYSHEIHIR